jgi:hypothetical protein
MNHKEITVPRWTLCVAALALIASQTVTTAADGSPTAPASHVPITHAAASPTVYSVALRWQVPARDDVTRVRVRRVPGRHWHDGNNPNAGTAVADVAAAAGHYNDWQVVPDGVYTYALFAHRAGHFTAPVYLHATVQDGTDATRYVAIYAKPKDVSRASRTAAIQHELGEVLAWYGTQTSGLRPRFLRSHGAIVVKTLAVPLTKAQLASSAHGNDSLTDLTKYLARSGLVGRSTIPIIYAESSSNTFGNCGVDGGYVAVLWMRACGGIYPSTTTAFPYGATYLAAHEMTHAMGAVLNCAPHSTGDGHVSDSPRDILYEGPQARDWAHLVLDYRHNDYYKTGRQSCVDISHDKVWETAP